MGAEVLKNGTNYTVGNFLHVRNSRYVLRLSPSVRPPLRPSVCPSICPSVRRHICYAFSLSVISACIGGPSFSITIQLVGLDESFFVSKQDHPTIAITGYITMVFAGFAWLMTPVFFYLFCYILSHELYSLKVRVSSSSGKESFLAKILNHDWSRQPCVHPTIWQTQGIMIQEKGI